MSSKYFPGKFCLKQTTWNSFPNSALFEGQTDRQTLEGTVALLFLDGPNFLGN